MMLPHSGIRGSASAHCMHPTQYLIMLGMRSKLAIGPFSTMSLLSKDALDRHSTCHPRGHIPIDNGSFLLISGQVRLHELYFLAWIIPAVPPPLSPHPGDTCFLVLFTCF